jgi:molybdenum cofactor guanylyltransferase
MNNPTSILGIILAGGLSRRMGGGDKCLLPLAGKTLLQRSIERAQPQVNTLVLNANGNSLRFARSKLPVIADNYTHNLGPLAGIHSGLEWMRANHSKMEWLASFASDTPFFPTDVVARLLTAAIKEKNPLAVAISNHQIQPIFALWHESLLDKIETQLKTGQIVPMCDWVQEQKPVLVEFSATGYDPFFNINTPQDMYTAESMTEKVK